MSVRHHQFVRLTELEVPPADDPDLCRGGCFENALHGMREERGLVHHATVLALRQSLHPGLCRITTWIRDARVVVEGALEAGVGVAYDSWRAPEGVGEASDVDLGDAKCQCTTVEAADASAEAADIPVDGLVGVAMCLASS